MIADDRIQAMAESLSRVSGVKAVVLGGSRAKGTHHAGSDVDLGLYYDRRLLDVEELRQLTVLFADAGPVNVSGPGSWGPWVDGGGWLTVDGTAVDWILRDLDRVAQQCRRAEAGEFAFHSQPGHPLGFLDVSYAGELATCLPLADPERILDPLRAALTPYPPALRASMIENLWQAGFYVDAARKGIPKLDVGYIALCCSTALMLCAHAWHASAGSWVTNEKGAIVDVQRLPTDSHDFAARAATALTRLSTDTPQLVAVVDSVDQLVADTRTALHED